LGIRTGKRKRCQGRDNGKIKQGDGMTKTKWLKQQRRIRKQARDEERQLRADPDFVYKMAPLRIFAREISDITYECTCTAESIRQGEFCPICRLTAPIRKEMWNLFKDVAEGRSRDTE
jgi:hypothetical protein